MRELKYYPTTAPLPGSLAQFVNVSRNGTLIAATSPREAPYLWVYRCTDNTVLTEEILSEYPTTDGTGIGLSPDDRWIVYTVGKGLVYKDVNGTFTRQPGELSSVINVKAATFSNDGRFLAAIGTGSGNDLEIYSVTEDSLTLLPGTPQLSAGSDARAARFSPDDGLLIVTFNGSPYAAAYSHDGNGNFTPITPPDFSGNTGQGYDISFSADGSVLAIAKNLHRQPFIYSVNGTTFTRRTVNADTSGACYGVIAFGSGEDIYTASYNEFASGRQFRRYTWNGASYDESLADGPDDPPGYVYGIAKSLNEDVVIVGMNDVGDPPYLRLYAVPPPTKATTNLEWNIAQAAVDFSTSLVWTVEPAIAEKELSLVWGVGNPAENYRLSLEWSIFATRARALWVVWDIEVPPLITDRFFQWAVEPPIDGSFATPQNFVWRVFPPLVIAKTYSKSLEWSVINQSYDDADKSTSDGQPLEFFEFAIDNHFLRYTNAESDLEFNGEVYESFPISRGPIVITGDLNSNRTVDVTFPSKSKLARTIAFGATPATIRLTIYGKHRDAEGHEIRWTGFVLQCDTKDDATTASVGSVIQSEINKNIGNLFYQKLCNNVLYGERCKVSAANFTTRANVKVNNGLSIIVDDDGVSDVYLNNGEIINERTNESRSIISNASNVITVLVPFSDLVKGDSVLLRAGCDRSIETCKTKFDNVRNFLGFPYIPPEQAFANAKYDILSTEIRNQPEQVAIGLPPVGTFAYNDFENAKPYEIMQPDENKQFRAYTAKYLAKHKNDDVNPETAASNSRMYGFLLGATVVHVPSGETATIVNHNFFGAFKLDREIEYKQFDPIIIKVRVG